MTVLVEMSSSWIWTRMVSSLALDSFNATQGQQVCLFKKELTTLVKNSFISYKLAFNKGKGLCFFRNQLMTLEKNSIISCSLLFSRKVNEQLQVVNIMSWGMSKQHSGQVATSKDGGFKKMKSWGILISKFRLTGFQGGCDIHDIIAAKALREQELDESVDLRHKLCGKSHQVFPSLWLKFAQHLRIWHNLPHLNAKASSFGWACEVKQRRSESSQLQASDCRLDKSADTGEQTFTSQMLLSTLALETRLCGKCLGVKNDQSQKAALRPLAVNCCQIMLDSIWIHLQSTSAHLINLFACNNQVAIKATNSTQGPGDHKLAMGSGTGYMIHACCWFNIQGSISLCFE